MKTETRLAAVLSAVFALALSAAAQDATNSVPPASTKTGVTYDTDIKPILDKSCVKCHSGEKPRAKLKLDSLDDLMQGSRNGKILIIGDSAKSTVIQCVSHTTDDDDEWMPPVKAEARFPRLTAEQIGLLRAWIDQGAK